MGTRIIKIGLLFLFTFLFTKADAQKREFISDQEGIISSAKNSLKALMLSEDMQKWKEKNEMSGDYLFEITIGGKKSEVTTIRAISRSEDGEIMKQNELKDYIKQYRFPIKLPKEKSYQFRYEFNF